MKQLSQLMYRLGALESGKRLKLGAAMLTLGFVGLAMGVVIVHYAQMPRELVEGGVRTPIEVGPLGDLIPLNKWVKFAGYLVSLGASQLMVLGGLFLWVLNQKMTWARAAVASFLSWVELVIVFGIVPSEWLNFSQTDLDMSPAKIALTMPRWLVLGNDVAISQAAVKDSVSMGYHLVMLGLGAVLALKLQDIGKLAPAQPEPVSPYGRPLVRESDS
jgi:hypothetical protein